MSESRKIFAHTHAHKIIIMKKSDHLICSFQYWMKKILFILLIEIFQATFLLWDLLLDNVVWRIFSLSFLLHFQKFSSTFICLLLLCECVCYASMCVCAMWWLGLYHRQTGFSLFKWNRWVSARLFSYCLKQHDEKWMKEKNGFRCILLLLCSGQNKFTCCAARLWLH